MTKHCYYCSYPNSDTATRCVNCGLKLETYWDKSGASQNLSENGQDNRKLFILL